MNRVEFFFDVASPYSYLCATQIDAVAHKHGAEVVWRPMLLGGVFKASGNDMPARIPAKAKWMLGDLQMWAKHYRVPFNFPVALFPLISLKAMRACAHAESAGKAQPMAKSLFESYWIRGLDPNGEEALGQASRAAALDPAAVLAAIDAPPAKDALRKSTDEAIARGAFGAPTMFIGETMLWGNDRLPLLDRLLAGDALAEKA
jgi:2-hydroxychromene-2-carboxylate isomerase